MLRWATLLRAKWELMSPSERVYAVWNGSADFVLLVFLIAAVRVGATTDPNAFVFWVPFLSIALFFRFKQMRTRWGL